MICSFTCYKKSDQCLWSALSFPNNFEISGWEIKKDDFVGIPPTNASDLLSFVPENMFGNYHLFRITRVSDWPGTIPAIVQHLPLETSTCYKVAVYIMAWLKLPLQTLSQTPRWWQFHYNKTDLVITEILRFLLWKVGWID